VVAESDGMEPEAEQPGESLSEWAYEEPAGDESVSFALEEVARALFSDAGSAPEASVEDVAAAVEEQLPAAVEEELPAIVEPVAPPAAAIEVPMAAAAAEAVSDADAEWATVDQLMASLRLMPLAAIEATEEDEWIAPIRDPQRVTEKSESVVDTPASGGKSEQEWVALVESLRHDVERIRTERADPPAPRTAPAPSSRPRKPKPAQDEWGLFDPEQCGFAALLAKLEEVTEEERSRS